MYNIAVKVCLFKCVCVCVFPDHFSSFEDYGFTLYPIFPDGEGEAIFVEGKSYFPGCLFTSLSGETST